MQFFPNKYHCSDIRRQKVIQRVDFLWQSTSWGIYILILGGIFLAALILQLVSIDTIDTVGQIDTTGLIIAFFLSSLVGKLLKWFWATTGVNPRLPEYGDEILPDSNLKKVATIGITVSYILVGGLFVVAFSEAATVSSILDSDNAVEFLFVVTVSTVIAGGMSVFISSSALLWHFSHNPRMRILCALSRVAKKTAISFKTKLGRDTTGTELENSCWQCYRNVFERHTHRGEQKLVCSFCGAPIERQ